MSPEGRKRLEQYRHVYTMWINDRVLLNTSWATDVQDIIRKEINPGYTQNLWCGKCCADMLETAFRHLDSLPKPVINELHTPNGINRAERRNRRR